MLAGLLVLCGGVVAGGLVIADRAGVFDDPDDSDPTEPPADGYVAWVTVSADEPSLDLLLSDLASEFSERYTAEVTHEPVPADAYRAMLESRLGNGSVQVFETPGGSHLRNLVERGLVRDLTDELADVIALIPPALLTPYTIDGRVYALPTRASVAGIWYNRALFADAGLDPDNPPATWSDLLDAVATLKDAGIAPVALGGLDQFPLLFWYGYLATRAAGANAFDAALAERSLRADQGYEFAAELLEQFIAAEPFQPGHESATYAGPDGQIELMANGEAAMELMGDWAPGTYESVSGSAIDDIGWFPFPAVNGGSGPAAEIYGGGAGLTVAADAPDTALELLRFLLSEETYPRIASVDTSLLPVRTDLGIPVEPWQEPLVAAVEDAPAMQLYLDSALPGDVARELNAGMSQLLVGDMTADQLIDRTTDLWQVTDD